MNLHCSPSSVIRGKWHQRAYIVESELGRGANGVVFAVRHDGRRYALKISDDYYSLTTEINVLKKCRQAQGAILGPTLYDVDDGQIGDKQYPFYVMTVIEGMPLLTFIKKRGDEWSVNMMSQLLTFLADLHRNGWVFGDLKPEHLVVQGQPPRLAWLDPGGITPIGRAVKEYTEVYDRGFWHMGDRRAEAQYDLFSVGIIFLQLIHRSLSPPDTDRSAYLKQLSQKSGVFGNVIWRALNGSFQSATEMKHTLITVWQQSRHSSRSSVRRKEGRQSRPTSPPTSKRRNSAVNNGRVTGTKSKTSPPPGRDKLKTAVASLFSASFLLLAFALYLFYQVP